MSPKNPFPTLSTEEEADRYLRLRRLSDQLLLRDHRQLLESLGIVAREGEPQEPLVKVYKTLPRDL